MKTCSAFHLYIVAFDEATYQYLTGASLPQMTVVSLAQFEDDQLRAVKPTRSVAEYCWTCTPSAILYFIEQYHLDACTYLDADMVFYADASVLYHEIGQHSVALSEHRYTPEYDPANGTYCVQFVYFRNDDRGLTALRWWRERCLEWCYARLEDGKFGDQKYLDDWTTRFEGVHVLQHEGAGVAPWNVQQFSIRKDEDRFILTAIDNRKETSLVFYHFHGLKFYRNGMVSCCGTLYALDEAIKKLIYFPYIKTLMNTADALRQEQVTDNANGARSNADTRWRTYLKYVRERLVLLKMGNITLQSLRLLDFKPHYHFYKTDYLKNLPYA